MADEVTTDAKGIDTNALGDSIYDDFTEAMGLLQKSKESEKGEEPAVNQPEAEVNEETKTEEKAEITETPQPDAKAETPPVETVKPEVKPLYTPEEIRKEIELHGDLAKLDSARLSEEGKLIQKSIMSGLTPKLQRAAEVERNLEAMLQRERERAEKAAREEAERKYREEAEQYGEEIAQDRRERRELKAKIESIERERAEEREQMLTQQRSIIAEKFHLEFLTKCKDFGIPATKEWEAEVTARVVNENLRRQWAGEPYINIEDGMKMVAETVGLSDAARLEELLNANPKVREALEAKWSEKMAGKKSAGPTVVKPSASGGANKQIISADSAPTKDELSLLERDPEEFAFQESMKLLKQKK